MIDPRIIDGIVRDYPMQGIIIITDPEKENGWGAEELFDGMMGKRVRVTVEVLEGETMAKKKVEKRVLIIRRNGAFETYADPGVEAKNIGSLGLSLLGENLGRALIAVVDYDADPLAEIPKGFHYLLDERRMS